jgi:hypothetical protein
MKRAPMALLLSVFLFTLHHPVICAEQSARAPNQSASSEAAHFDEWKINGN